MVTLKNKRISGRLGEAMKQIYICEDTITGIYSALHDAWKECRDTQAGVELRGRTQRQLFCEYRIVEESWKYREEGNCRNFSFPSLCLENETNVGFQITM